ncbi:MAG: DsbA family protein, partial [Magnetovibrio sp.]|nr:DsbA family protein [Magnetovibrio sp.]
DRTRTYNSRLAQEVGSWAETVAPGSDIHDKFFEAYFVDGRNVGDTEVVLDVVKSAGLDANEAGTVIEERRFKDAVDADWAKSRQYGVTGVPTFVAGGKGLVGAQPVEMLEHLMTEVGAARRGG